MTGAPRHVGVNLLWLVPGVVGGSEEYTTRLLRAVAELDPADLRLTLFALEPFVEAHPDLVAAFPTVVAPLDGHRRPERVATEATWLALQAGRRGVDLLHHAGGVVPPGPASARVPSVLTVHDLQPLEHPEHFSPVKRRWLATMLPRSVRRARLVLTPSDPASASVVRLLGVPADRVATVPHGVVAPGDPDESARRRVRDRYRLDGPIVLYPAITYPHKGHERLVTAFAEAAKLGVESTSNRSDHLGVESTSNRRQGAPGGGEPVLVLTGGAGSREAAVAAAVRRAGVGDRVRRTGRVPWADLEVLYAEAAVVAVPSRYEGFGAPALEAMAAGAPLVAADATALPWVVGDGGLLVDPDDAAVWASTLRAVLDDDVLRADLAARGRARAASFTWDRAGRALLDGYRRALELREDGSS